LLTLHQRNWPAKLAVFSVPSGKRVESISLGQVLILPRCFLFPYAMSKTSTWNADGLCGLTETWTAKRSLSKKGLGGLVSQQGKGSVSKQLEDHCEKDLVILNHAQMMRTIPEMPHPYPNFHTTHQEDVSPTT
ncbi:hypothetical protein AVEN_178662-1, partial [Araneus ventricosus]